MSRHDVVALGVAVVDITARPADKRIFERDNTPMEQILISPGGDAVNQAIALSKLGVDTSLCCRIGADAMGEILQRELEAQGVDTSQVMVSDESVTSTAIVLVAEDGGRHIVCSKGNNYDFCIDDIDMGAVTNTRALSVGSVFGLPKLEETGLKEVLRASKAEGVVTFADMGSDKKGRKLDGVRPFLPFIDWFAPSEVESAYLTGGLAPEEAAKAFLDTGANNAVIKLGSRGVYAACEDFTGYVDPFEVMAVDTTGAGDAFCAGLIYGVLGGKKTVDALTFACGCGALSTRYMGANSALLSEDEVKDFIEQQR